MRRVDRADCPQFFAPSTQPGVFIPIVARSPGRGPLVRPASPLVAPLKHTPSSTQDSTLCCVFSTERSASYCDSPARPPPKICAACVGLKTPHEQKTESYNSRPARGVRRPSRTQSINFFASEWLTMPCLHMVESIMTFEPGSFSVDPSNPSEYPTLWRGMPAAKQHCSAPSIDVEILDAELEIRILHRRDKILGRHAIVEHRGHRSGPGEPVNDPLKIRRDIAIPVRGRDSFFETDAARRHGLRRPD